MAAFSVLKDRVGYFAGQADTDTNDTIGGYSFTDFVGTAINRAVERMQRDHLWKDLWTVDTSLATVASTKTVDISSLSANFIESVVIEDTTNSRQSIFIDRDTIDAFYPYPEGDSEGCPNYCIRRGLGTLEFNPIPDAAYDLWIYFYKWATAMSLDASTPSINYVDDVIEAGAMAEICFAKKLIDDAAVWEAKYQQRLKEAIVRDNKRPEYSPSPRAIGGAVITPGSYWAKPDYGMGLR